MATNETKVVIIPPREVVRRCGLSRSTLYRLTDEGVFPRPVALTSARSGFVESEVDQWIADRIAARDATPATGGAPQPALGGGSQ